MSDLTIFLGEAIVGRKLPDDSADLRTHLAALISIGGSKAGAARLVGVSPTTMYRWTSGRQKPGKSRTNKALAVITRRAALSKEREKAARREMKGMTIHGVIHVSKDTKKRKIRVGPWFPKSILTKIFNAWLRGDDRRCDSLIRNAVEKYYTAGMSIGDITAVTFDEQ